MTHSIGIVAVPNCMSSSVTGPYDIFSMAAYEWQRLTGLHHEPLFQPIVISLDGRPVTAFNGLSIHAEHAISASRRYDIVFLPTVFGDLTDLLPLKALPDWLRTQHANGSCLASVCAGSFLIAQTGLLNGRRATTHWKLADNFAARFPQVLLQREKMLVDEGDIITAGGVSAYQDLSLHICRRFGSHDLSSSLARMLLIDPGRTSQVPYHWRPSTTGHGDQEISIAQQWLDTNYTTSFSMSELADRAGLGERTFNRRFKKATGEPPLEYLQRLRIEAARHLLETTKENLDDITFKVGYEDTSSFRKLFKRHTGLTPHAYRKRFYFLP